MCSSPNAASDASFKIGREPGISFLTARGSGKITNTSEPAALRNAVVVMSCMTADGKLVDAGVQRVDSLLHRGVPVDFNIDCGWDGHGHLIDQVTNLKVLVFAAGPTPPAPTAAVPPPPAPTAPPEGAAPAVPNAAPSTGCDFVLGFAALRDRIGAAAVGTCLESQQTNVDNGDAYQKTSNGLLVWRKADNWTAFTNGYQTWINGPNGLQQRLNTQRYAWEGDAGAPGTTLISDAPAQAPSAAVRPPAAPPAPAPTAAPAAATLEIIPGIAAADITLSLTDRGFVCSGATQMQTLLSWTCDRSGNAGVSYNVLVYGDTPTRIRFVNASISAPSGVSDEAAFFNLLATLPYTGAEPAKAQEWVRTTLPVARQGAVNETAIGGVRLQLFGSPTSRSFRFGYLPFPPP